MHTQASWHQAVELKRIRSLISVIHICNGDQWVRSNAAHAPMAQPSSKSLHCPPDSRLGMSVSYPYQFSHTPS